jgi:hypothetical protein
MVVSLGKASHAVRPAWIRQDYAILSAPIGKCLTLQIIDQLSAGYLRSFGFREETLSCH